MGFEHLISHTIWSCLFVFGWIPVVLVIETVKYAVLAVWALYAWVTTSLLTLKNAAHKPLYWEWHKFDVDDLQFPENFLWGVCTAAHQVEGGNTNNNWSKWEKTRRLPILPPPTKDPCGDACDHWNRVDEDTELITKLGVKSHRFSVEWSRVEPRQGEYDQTAIDHYHYEIDLMRKSGITPMITLLHFTTPLWFDELGGFEDEKNIPLFVVFSRRMYKEYGGKISLWCTVNEPNVQALQSYATGLFPPGKLLHFQTAGRFLLNLLKAHVEAYLALHEEADAAKREVMVGIVKDIFNYHPHKWYNLMDHYCAYQCNLMFNKAMLKFLRTGRFHWWMPFLTNVVYTDRRAPKCNDFVGLNYYSHFYTSFGWMVFGKEPADKMRPGEHELMTDMPTSLYPEGFYLALMETAKLGKPIYVTESGVADKDDTRRPLYIKRYLYAMSRAIQDGVDIRGYYYWCLMDNFEWCEGFNMKFGLYAVDFETQKRTLRDSAKYFTSIVDRYHKGDLRIKGKAEHAQDESGKEPRPKED